MVFSVDNDDGSWSVVEKIKQSPPIDLTKPYDTASLAGKTILITGGASGFGAAFARHWAAHGSHIIIGDVNDAAGEELVAELRSSSSSSKTQHFYYQHCDVTSWEQQVSLFKFAVQASPTGGIDGVVAGAGIVDLGNEFDTPRRLDVDSPPPPPLKVINVNVMGVMYTTHLALYYLPRNGTRSGTDQQTKDRHILLVSSIAGLAPLAGQTEYCASKHAVMGLFRSLRGTSWRRGVRVNVINPYFVDTALLPNAGLALLAGAPRGELKDVVDAATRLMADEEVVGRALVIGPKMRVVDGDDGEPRLVEDGAAPENARQQAVWEIYGHDYARVDVFVYRYIAMLNVMKNAMGLMSTVKDLWGIYVTGKKAAPKK
ncbi:putative dehydrogenase [Podospora australis]|uniref:Dehydrogenase n=1 Tax=Podospora australis TaxID=1536484 RepID=A0AAN6WY11_9PEZI|nr:putative dehydrogenase [Podospora australis]